MLDDLHDPEVRERLRQIWANPHALDPAAHSARVTRTIADLLAKVAKRLEARGHDAERVSGFLMRLLFTMFAEDAELIPRESFTNLLKSQREHPEHLSAQLTALWQAMDQGDFAPALGMPVKQFNGYLFKDRTAIDLELEELDVLIAAAGHRWTEVEPAIFGTLLERALNPKERSKLGAHYTPRAYVERLIGPAIMQPLRGDWDAVRTAATALIDADKTAEARDLVQAFHTKLAATRVLDPACGTGNFLYVALARMKELEGEVLELLEDLASEDDEYQYTADLTGHTITPENFLGIEVNPRAVEIAQLVLWIGYLQWHFRVSGEGRAPPEPILRDIRTIEHRDALIRYNKRVQQTDDDGQPITRWDGETMKPHPVTGKNVPDETARVESWRFIKPAPAKWPKVDFIVGNPPFIGGKDVRERLGPGYFDALFAVSKINESADFVMHWWGRAAEAVRSGTTRRFGFVATNSITQTFARRTVAKYLDAKKGIALAFAIPNHPWVDGADGAAVRIAMTVGNRADEDTDGLLLTVKDESGAPNDIAFLKRTGRIGADLRIGSDVTKAVALKANDRLSSRGVQLMGSGFIVTPEEAARLHSVSLAIGHGQQQDERPRIRTGSDAQKQIIFDYRNGRDLTARPRDVMVIDAYGLSEPELRERYPAVWQRLHDDVKPHRDSNNRASYRENWWLYGEPRSELRKVLAGCERYIATVETAKHRVFQFLPTSIVPDNMVVAIALPDAWLLSVLSSFVHTTWALASGARLGVGDDPRYSKTRCFDPFPFPVDVPEELKNTLRTEAEQLDALRKNVLAEHVDLTLTKLYNVLEALQANNGQGRTLSEAERDIHERGLVTLIRRHHDAID